MTRQRPVVAIDGPAGAGKSTVTRGVADALGYTRVDTGALYRTVAWLSLERGADLEDEESVGRFALELAAPGAIEMSSSGPTTGVVALGQDVSSAIREQHVGQGASQVSALPAVRAALLDIQRQLGRDGGVVLEGRDIGSVVFPDAETKFYLTASAEVRGARRLAELQSKGINASLEEIVAEVNERDARDRGREIAPLCQAEDAILVDSSAMTIDEVVATIVSQVRAVADKLVAG